MENPTFQEAPPPGRLSDVDPVPRDPNEYGAMFCRTCGRARVFRRRRVNHPRHFVLSIATLGVWLPVWGAIIILQVLKKWTCTVCNSLQLS